MTLADAHDRRTAPDERTATLLVTGFLGSGKSRIVRMLTGAAPAADGESAPFQDRPAGIASSAAHRVGVIEGSPFVVPGRDPSAAEVVLTTVDAVNAVENLADRDLETLVAGQIRAADIVVLTCGDVADPGPARRAISDLTDAPVIEAHAQDDLAQAILGHATPRPAPPRTSLDHGAAFTVWSYSGSAVLTNEAMVAFVAGRPEGAYRIKGTVMLHEGGGEIDVFGRGRRTWAIGRPRETHLSVAGPASRLLMREMDLAFAEAVSAAAYGRGVIACR